MTEKRKPENRGRKLIGGYLLNRTVDRGFPAKPMKSVFVHCLADLIANINMFYLSSNPLSRAPFCLFPPRRSRSISDRLSVTPSAFEPDLVRGLLGDFSLFFFFFPFFFSFFDQPPANRYPFPVNVPLFSDRV